jgi:hypothetical protein
MPSSYITVDNKVWTLISNADVSLVHSSDAPIKFKRDVSLPAVNTLDFFVTSDDIIDLTANGENIYAMAIDQPIKVLKW